MCSAFVKHSLRVSMYDLESIPQSPSPVHTSFFHQIGLFSCLFVGFPQMRDDSMNSFASFQFIIDHFAIHLWGFLQDLSLFFVVSEDHA